MSVTFDNKKRKLQLTKLYGVLTATFKENKTIVFLLSKLQIKYFTISAGYVYSCLSEDGKLNPLLFLLTHVKIYY